MIQHLPGRQEGRTFQQKNRQVQAWHVLYNGAEEMGVGVGVGGRAWRGRSGHEGPFKPLSGVWN